MSVAARLMVFTAVAAVTFAAAPPVELRRLFPQEAEVQVERPGLVRLDLPGEVLAACRPDLSDLRLFDSDDRELPFLVDGGGERAAVFELAQRFDAPLLDMERGETRRATGPPLHREVLEFGVPNEPPRARSMDLVCEIARPEFVARVDVAALDEKGAATSLVEGGSLFRLRNPRRAEKLRLELPPFEGRRLRLTLETEHPFWLEPAVRLEAAERLTHETRIAVPLAVVSLEDEPQRTIVTLERPRGLVPGALRLGTTTRAFDRQVVVRDDGPAAAEGALGSGRMFRVAAFATVEELDLALREPRGDRLRVEIDNGDSPPLEEPSFAAVVRRPALIFAVESGGGAGKLRFGGGRAHVPRYDLAAFLPPPGTVLTGDHARAAAMLHDPEVVGTARLGPLGSNPLYDRAPALGFALRAGAEVEREAFRYRRPLRVGEAPEGLSRLRLEPADLAVLRADLADLRVADADSRQRPFLLERDAGSTLLPLAVSEPKREARRSHYELRPPVEPLVADRLLLDAEAPFFDRAFELRAKLEEGDEAPVASGRLVRRSGDESAIGIDLRPLRARALTLIVEDGDDAPLALRDVRANVRLPDLYLAAPAGEYSLLLGEPEATAADYELSRVRDVVLAVRAAPVEAGALVANPDFSLRARLGRGGAALRIALWVVLVGTVVVLAALTLRLARS